MSAQETSETLLPCPFCGGDAMFCNDRQHDEPHECHYIVCNGCQLSIEWNDPYSTKEAEEVDDLRAHAIKKWNQRV